MYVGTIHPKFDTIVHRNNLAIGRAQNLYLRTCVIADELDERFMLDLCTELVLNNCVIADELPKYDALDLGTFSHNLSV